MQIETAAIASLSLMPAEIVPINYTERDLDVVRHLITENGQRLPALVQRASGRIFWLLLGLPVFARMLCAKPASVCGAFATNLCTAVNTLFDSAIGKVPAVNLPVALFAQCNKVRIFKTKVWVISPRFDVMRVQLALCAAILAGVLVTLKNAYSQRLKQARKSPSFAFERLPIFPCIRFGANQIFIHAFAATINLFAFFRDKVLAAVGALALVDYASMTPTFLGAILSRREAVLFDLKLRATYPTNGLDALSALARRNSRSTFVRTVNLFFCVWTKFTSTLLALLCHLEPRATHKHHSVGKAQSERRMRPAKTEYVCLWGGANPVIVEQVKCLDTFRDCAGNDAVGIGADLTFACVDLSLEAIQRGSAMPQRKDVSRRVFFHPLQHAVRSQNRQFAALTWGERLAERFAPGFDGGWIKLNLSHIATSDGVLVRAASVRQHLCSPSSNYFLDSNRFDSASTRRFTISTRLSFLPSLISRSALTLFSNSQVVFQIRNCWYSMHASLHAFAYICQEVNAGILERLSKMGLSPVLETVVQTA